MSLIELAAAIIVQLAWGVQYVTTKYGLDSFPPLLFASMRFTMVAIALLPLAGWPSRRELAAAALMSVFFGGLAFGLYFLGIHLGAAGLSSVIAQLMTPFTVLFAWPILGERPSFRVILGIVVAFAGVTLALLDPGKPISQIAALLVAGGAASQAVGNVIVKRFAPLNSVRLMAWLALLAAPQIGVASALTETGQLVAVQNASVLAWLSLIYAVVIGAIIGFGLWFWLIGRLSLDRVAPFALLQTVFAIAAGVVLLHEAVSWPLLIGAAVCVSGVVVTQLPSSSGKG